MSELSSLLEILSGKVIGLVDLVFSISWDLSKILNVNISSVVFVDDVHLLGLVCKEVWHINISCIVVVDNINLLTNVLLSCLINSLLGLVIGLIELYLNMVKIVVYFMLNLVKIVKSIPIVVVDVSEHRES